MSSLQARLTQTETTSPVKNTGARVLAQWLVRHDIRTVFLVPGLQIDPIVAELCNTSGLQVITATHELTAGYMADGYARASGRPGICISIGTVGTASLLAAAVTAKADHSPVLFITGNVAKAKQHAGAFQDGWPGGTHDMELLRQAVGYSGVVHSASDLNRQLDAAVASMFGILQQPAHLCIPFDIQQESCTATLSAASPLWSEAMVGQRPLPKEWIQRLAGASRLMVLAGSRLGTARGAELLRAFAETFNIPVATTLSAKGLLPENHPLSLGNFGFAGSWRANESLLDNQTDLLLVVGADLNERDSLGWDPRLRMRHRTILSIDATVPSEQHPLSPDCQIHADATSILHHLLANKEALLHPLLATTPQRSAWIQSLSQIPRIYPAARNCLARPNTIAPDHLVLALRESLPENAILVVDAGLHRLFAGHFWVSLQAGAFFSACALAPLGWAIAAAIGIKLARPQQPVVVLTGDGCLQAHGNELATMARFELPILVVVCNNQAYGSIQRHHEQDARAIALTALPEINWIQYAKALGCLAAPVEDLSQLAQVLAAQMATLTQAHGKPLVLDVNTTGHMMLPNPTATRPEGWISNQPITGDDAI